MYNPFHFNVNITKPLIIVNRERIVKHKFSCKTIFLTLSQETRDKEKNILHLISLLKIFHPVNVILMTNKYHWTMIQNHHITFLVDVVRILQVGSLTEGR